MKIFWEIKYFNRKQKFLSGNKKKISKENNFLSGEFQNAIDLEDAIPANDDRLFLFSSKKRTRTHTHTNSHTHRAQPSDLAPQTQLIASTRHLSTKTRPDPSQLGTKTPQLKLKIPQFDSATPNFSPQATLLEHLMLQFDPQMPRFAPDAPT